MLHCINIFLLYLAKPICTHTFDSNKYGYTFKQELVIKPKRGDNNI